MVSSSLVYPAGKSHSSQPSFRTQQNSPKALVIVAIAATVLLWASAFPAIRVSLIAYTPTEVAFLRYLVASAILVIYAIVNRMPLPRLRDLPAIAFCGFIGFALYNVALNAGQRTVSAGMASFIISSEVGIIALLAWFLEGDRLGRTGWLGVLFCIIGVGIISFNTGSGFQLSSGVWLVFVATLAISLYSTIQKPLLQRYSALQFTTYAIWLGTIFLFFFAPDAILTVIDRPIASTIAIAYLGLFPGVIAYVAWSYVLSKIPASQAGSYLALIPFAALLISWIWLKEVPQFILLIGGAIVFGGILLINRRNEE